MSRAKSARQAKILAEIVHTPSLRVADLARLHGVSTETIRRDLDALTRAGHLSRTYGGAVAAPAEPALSERHRLYVVEREAIARSTVELVQNGTVFFIGSGATTVHVARRMATTMQDITVFTHSFSVATVLANNPGIRVHVLAGEYVASEGAMVGSATLAQLQSINADWAILGASGLDHEGPTEALLDCSQVYGAMMRRARGTVLVADHSKFRQRYPGQYAYWPQITHVVCDAAPDAALHGAIGPNRLVVAPPARV